MNDSSMSKIDRRSFGLPSMIAALVLLFGLGCSTLTHYPNQVADSRTMLRQQNFEDAYVKLEKKADSGLDKLCYMMELGMISHAKGDFKKSIKDFERVFAEFRYHDEKAVVSATDISSQTGSLLINEKSNPYKGAAYERIMAHVVQTLNYLFTGDLEGAFVENRATLEALDVLEKRYEEELEAAEEAARKKGVSSKGVQSKVQGHYRDLRAVGDRIASLYHNPFAYYLSSVIFDLEGEPNDAYIDLKRAHALWPDSRTIQQDLCRFARLSGFEDDYREWMERFGFTGLPGGPGSGEVIVIFEDGFIPPKEQVKIGLPIPRVGVVELAFPTYTRAAMSPRGSATLYDGSGHLLGGTEMIVDIEAMAVRDLLDQVSVLVLKQAIRATIKGVTTHQAMKEGGPLAGLAANVFTAVTEQADLRSWLTLPANIQVAKLYLDPGRHALKLVVRHGRGGRTERVVDLDVRASGKRFINVRSLGGSVVVHTL